MDLIKKNIHMDRTRTEAVKQFALEDDVNIPDQKPDVNTLNLEKGEVVVEEIRPGTDSIHVKGYLKFNILYHTTEDGSTLAALEGSLPFEEKINLTGATSTDTVSAEGTLEDLTVGMINSRKLNVQSLITLSVWIDELYDEEIPTALHGDEKVEHRRIPLEVTQIAICKNDIFRLKEEVSLPSGYPNIYRILWDTVSLGDMEFKAMDEKIAISGDVHLFLLYEGEGENHPVRSYETIIPLSGSLDCHGCREGMLPDIRYHLGQKEISVRPDFDGEERCVGLDLVLEIAIRMYEEEKLDMITDVYGVTSEVETVSHETVLRRLLSRITGKTKLTEHVSLPESNVLQLLHSEGSVTIEQQSIIENGIQLSGELALKVMYITGDDETPYRCTEVMIPYQYTLEIPEIKPQDMGRVHPEVEQLQIAMLDGEEMDVKAILSFSTVVFQNIPVKIISQITQAPLDTVKMGNLPGMAVYMVKEGDNLWNIGKKYYVPVDSLRELNQLDSDEVKPGQKLLIVKEG